MAETIGLSEQEARRRLSELGENTLTQARGSGALGIFANQFKDLMTLILLGCTALSVLMGEVAEAGAIAVIVLMNALLGFLQEYRTEKTLEELKNLSAPIAMVLRDGRPTEIDARAVVVGDALLLRAGERVAADARLIEGVALACDEALLTGESVPVEKSPETDARVLMGTVVTKGHGTAIVEHTGMATEMGSIAGLLEEIDEGPTPLQQRLAQLGKWIAAGCLIICAVVTLAGVLRGEALFEMIVTGISLAVAAVPEGLPAIVTISLALAVRRILRRGSLVKNLYAVETLGCASVICTDKTGTLTENRMTVRALWTDAGEAEVTGEADRTGGGFWRDGRQLLTLTPAEQLLLKCGCYCSASSIRPVRGGWQGKGEPTEIALLIAAARAEILRPQLPGRVVDELPFDSTRKRMSVLVEEQGEQCIYAKGAVDYLLPRCSRILCANGVRPLTEAMRARIAQENEALAARAMRVLGLAYRPAATGLREEGLIFLGLAGMIDPPRAEVPAAVRACRGAHIRPVMITGDHRLTATAIAREVGILQGDEGVLTGAELDGLSDAELRRRVGSTAVFARVTPAHKLRIVRALKANGEVVAMTGDGVNDAPALKEADIGVSMGVGGSAVAKEAANMILLDDNFATLVAAVEEGRIIYANIRRFVRYLLSCNIGEVVTMFLGMLMGMPVVLAPIQILLVNLATDGLPAIALGFEPAEEENMRRRPRGAQESIFAGGLAGTIVFRGVLIGLATLGAYSVFFGLYGDLATARTGALCTLIFTQLIHVFECKSEHHSLFGVRLFSNLRLVAGVLCSAGMALCTIYLPMLQRLFGTVALGREQLLLVAGFCLAGPVIWAAVLGMDSLHRERSVSRLQVGD